MSARVGVWVDRRKAIFVTLEGEAETVRVLESDLEPQTRMTGGPKRPPLPYGAQQFAAERKFEHRYQRHFKDYLTEVAEGLTSADAILIFGPADAKHELEKILREKRLDDRIADVQTADSMTDPQVAAYVRDYFREASA